MKNVHYINAGAGAGKTYTLVTILKEILTDKNNPCAPSEIILTTYTKAAAKEFREKTFKRLLEAPAALDVAKILDTATIGTVHSVAQQYIQRYWSLLGYSGQFNVMSDTDKERYINKSLKNVAKPDDLSFFYDYTKEFDVKYYDAKKELSRPDYDFWKKYVLEIVSKMRAYNIDPSNLGNFAKESCCVVDRLFGIQFSQARFCIIIEKYIDYLKGKAAQTKKDGTPTKDAINNQKRLKIYDDFSKLFPPSDNEIAQLIESDCLKASISSGKNDDENEKAEKKVADKSKKAALDYLKNFLLWSKLDKSKIKNCIERIFRIARDWAKQFEEYKRTNNLLDFDDLEAKFLILLKKQEVQDDIRSSVKYLFVDEFQDSNPIQLEIFKKLSDLVQVKSYWVGDRKQAIYGFRGSDSSLTTNLLKSFPDPKTGVVSGTPAYGCTSQLIDTSYRSIQSLVELANEVFEKSFAAGASTEIIDNVPLKYKRVDGNITNPIQHWHCNSEDALADRVAEILNGNVSTIPGIPGVYDGDGPDVEDSNKDKDWREQIVPADIAVLSRTGAEVSKIEEALRKKGIPVSSPETSIMDKAEVKLVMALLKYVASIKRRYAKTELAKLLEDKEIGDILKEIAAHRYDYNPFFDEEVVDADAGKSKETVDDKEIAIADSDAVKGTSEVVAEKVTHKDPDSFFADLNDKLQGLRGLNISAIVKGVIAVMDVRNIVAKWGNAEIRQDNLDTLIEQAIAYEQSTAHSSDCATVAGFIQYMNDVEIQSELDQSAEGVKVATYHKSKGLQWKIVILNSLDDNELELKNFVKKNWFGLNLKGDYGKAELQLIPNCGDVSFAMAGIVEDLSKCSPSKDDNGYFNLLRGKVEGEIKRLLYVGVTRARDYLITISMPSGQYNTIKPLDWIKNVIESSAPVVAVPTALDLPAAQANKTPVDFWGVPTHPAYYEQLADLGNTFSCSATTHMKLDSAAISTETTPKCISPSSSQEKYNATAALVDGFSSDYIEHGTIKEGESAAFGTCIHNYMAAHRWGGKAKIKANETDNLALAMRTVQNHGMGAVLPKPKLLTLAADALFSYLEKTFGIGELLRETPFTYRRDNEQLVQGEIDLIWKTDKECILLDYKNFPAPEKWGKEIVLDDRSDNKFYVKKYFPQLGDYRAALTAAGENVTHVFIFYSVLGCLVEIKFE